MSRARPTATERARAGLVEARGTLADWEASLDAARAELAHLEATAGELALDDPAAAQDLPRRMQEQRDRILTAERAIEVQRQRVAAAESVYLLAEADALEVPVAALRADLERHEARTAELLQMLTEHEGPYVPEALLLEEQMVGNPAMSGHRELALPKSAVMRDAIEAAEQPVIVLRELAAGRVPSEHPALRTASFPAVYPACVWGPDALVPVPEYRRQVERVADHLRGLEELAEELPEQIQAVKERKDLSPGGVVAHVQIRQTKMAGLPNEIAAARAELEALTGANS